MNKTRVTVISLGLAALLLAGCGATRRAAFPVADVPLVAKHVEKAKTVKADSLVIGDTLTLDKAFLLALENNPVLKVYHTEIKVREARTWQASLLPNPELEIEVENFLGSGSYASLKEAETTLSLGQLIELAGKRAKRTKLAALQSDLAGWDYKAKQLDVFTEVIDAFVLVLASQERIKVYEELRNLATEFVKTISQRVKAGKISPAEAARAQVELSTTEIELQRARRELDAARQRLAATWGSVRPAFKRVNGKLEIPSSIPSLEKLRALIVNNPDLARWAVEMEERRAAKELEKAKRIPDPIVRGGYRRLSQTGDNAFIVGLSIPIQLFNRNQGAVQEAEYRIRQAEQQQISAETMVKTRLAERYQQLSTLYNEVTTLKGRIIPDARNAFDVINRGYIMGKFASIDVLDAQRTLFEARVRYLQSLTDFYRTTADIERLIGVNLANVK